jgi:hypothetical protein
VSGIEGLLQIPELSWDRAERAEGSTASINKLSENRTATIKLTTITIVSVDGLMQGLGGTDEGRRMARTCRDRSGLQCRWSHGTGGSQPFPCRKLVK